ncbi:MAG: hypothetical protein KJ043_15465, partial [Anaerolineae bacterium]|nr:hypothetical protein [Anaerolineae bacterium]
PLQEMDARWLQPIDDDNEAMPKAAKRRADNKRQKPTKAEKKGKDKKDKGGKPDKKGKKAVTQDEFDELLGGSDLDSLLEDEEPDELGALRNALS